MIDGIRFVTPTINSFHTVDLLRHDCPCALLVIVLFISFSHRALDMTLHFFSPLPRKFPPKSIISIEYCTNSFELVCTRFCALIKCRFQWKMLSVSKKILLFPFSSFRFVLIFILIHYDCYYIVELLLICCSSQLVEVLPVCIINNRCLCRIFVFRFILFCFSFIFPIRSFVFILFHCFFVSLFILFVWNRKRKLKLEITLNTKLCEVLPKCSAPNILDINHLKDDLSETNTKQNSHNNNHHK